uniref:Uncharacterized protein n=1 Tax=Timema bartmani TaxID=61472 RepID=A0A7R9F5W0_9NEOP|nr:unnamed protein product [Timema bartmani]
MSHLMCSRNLPAIISVTVWIASQVALLLTPHTSPAIISVTVWIASQVALLLTPHTSPAVEKYTTIAEDNIPPCWIPGRPSNEVGLTFVANRHPRLVPFICLQQFTM